jgi:uroporphyrinogen decarboxylase
MQEYRDIRAKHGFLEMCRTPELAVEVTLQPVDLVGVDAAILFSDILVGFPGMGLDLEFAKGEGPVIHNPIRSARDVDKLGVADPLEATGFVMETIRILRRELENKVPLIGFAGAPFTLASYLVEGGPSRNHARTKAMMLAEPANWHALMSKLTDLTIAFLRGQIDAGVDAIQVFDSWAGTLSLADYRQYVLPHSSRVFGTLAEYGVPMTHFGVGTAELLGAMSAAVKSEPGGKPGRVTVVGVDWRTTLTDAAARVEAGTALQGNLDPVVLLAGWPVVERAARAVVDDGRRAVDAGAAGHVFNLGHGVLPETDPGVLTELVSLVHSL